jgi:hypothetical protein
MDFRAYIDEQFGGVRAMQETLAEAGFDAPLANVRKWHTRNSIPCDAFAMSLLVLEFRNGAAFSLRPYFAESSCHHSLHKKPSITGAPVSIFD